MALLGCGESQQSAPAPKTKPIHDAAVFGNIEAVKKHLAAGADVNAKNENGETPLHLAPTPPIVELLIAEGADVNAKSRSGLTSLHLAAIGNQKKIAELLIAAGADVNAKDEDGGTPLDIAGAEIADLLRKHGGKTGAELEAEGK